MAPSAPVVAAAPVVPGPISESELKDIMAVNKDWPYPAHEDGWVRAHNALRADMKDLDAAFCAIVERLEKGEAVAPWMVTNLQSYFPLYVHLVHHHHDNEELIFFPELSKRVVVPPKLSADHVQLMQALTELSEMINALKPGRSVEDDMKPFMQLKERFQAYHAIMREHLQEEEDVGLPLLRKYMTRKEAAKVEARIIKGLTPQDMGWFLRPFDNDANRKKWMSEVAGIPGIVQPIIMLPATRKYKDTHAKKITDIVAGEQTRVPGCFGC